MISAGLPDFYSDFTFVFVAVVVVISGGGGGRGRGGKVGIYFVRKQVCLLLVLIILFNT